MAHFRTVIKGARGAASRLGHKTTGISTLLQTWGWNVSVEAAHANGEDTADIALVNATTGERRPLLAVNLETGAVIVNYAAEIGIIKEA